MSVVLLVATCFGLVGCKKESIENAPVAPVVEVQEEVEGVPAHPTEGPHGGDLIELGDEEYHAELIHDEEAGSIVIYMLDSSATKLVPIYATQLLINLSHDGEAEQFVLSANPQDSDPAEKSSRFISEDAELAEDLDLEDAKAMLVVKIAGKQFRGEIEHGHEGHEGYEAHSGEHGQEEGHEEEGHEEEGHEEEDHEEEDHEEEGHEEEGHEEEGHDEEGHDEEGRGDVEDEDEDEES